MLVIPKVIPMYMFITALLFMALAIGIDLGMVVIITRVLALGAIMSVIAQDGAGALA